jgi:16S rRNA (adenine1518-N6/adenine1519-N6)-dimethyltransferase
LARNAATNSGDRLMETVRAKKRLGQHFLKDQNIARKIVDSLSGKVENVLEIGAGMGVLTQFLLEKDHYNVSVVEIDEESVLYLQKHFPKVKEKIIEKDFLKLDIATLFPYPLAVIGNFPYNISSQILFKVLEHKNQIPEVVGMFQKEVALRLASAPGNKDYGILSVLLQAFYDIEYLFTVEADVFNPPPKVKSAVIRLKRNTLSQLNCDEHAFKRLVKTAFNQRRKTLRNSLKPLLFTDKFTQETIFNKRPEQLSVDEFVYLTQHLVHLSER